MTPVDADDEDDDALAETRIAYPFRVQIPGTDRYLTVRSQDEYWIGDPRMSVHASVKEDKRANRGSKVVIQFTPKGGEAEST